MIKKFNYLTILLSIFVFSSVTSCANFMQGSNLKKDIEEKIQHEKAAYCKVKIQANQSYSGTIVPSPNVYANVYKPSDDIELSYEPSKNYKFHYWHAVPEDSVRFESVSSLNTTAELLDDNDGDEIIIEPICVERPNPVLENPFPEDTRILNPKNSSITLSFTSPLDDIETTGEDMYLKDIDIKIEIAGEDISEYFQKPRLIDNNYRIQIDSRTDKILEFESGQKTVTVTVPAKLYFKTTDGMTVPMYEDKVLKYKIDYNTVEKLDLKLENVYDNKNRKLGEYDVSSNSLQKNIMETQVVNFMMTEKCYFKDWEITTANIRNGNASDFELIKDTDYTGSGSAKLVKDAEGNSVVRLIYPSEADAAILAASDMYRITVEILHTYDEPLIVKPLIYKKPLIEKFIPETAGLEAIAKDKPIQIKFASEINPDDVQKIQITKNGEDVSDCFLAPEISEDLTTVTYNVNYDNLLSVSGASESIVVTVPNDISYTADDGTIVYAGDVQTKSYRVNNNTDKTLLVTFANNSSGGVMNYSGSKYLSMGETIQLIYTTSSGFNFTGWSITGNIAAIDFDEEKLSEKTIIITAKNVGTVNITGDSVFYPEIDDYEPKYNINGVECDTPVTVTFNTLMDHSTINKDTVKITNKKTGADLSKYFDISCRDVNLITVVDFKVDESITELFKSNILSTFDIRILFNQNEIKSSEESGGAELTGLKYDWYYRINSGTEKVLPHITEMHLYKTKNADGSYSDELTDKDFAEWEDSDFYQNHVRKVYLKIFGYDDDSGLSHLNYSEKLFRTTIGTKSSLVAENNILGNKDDFEIVEELPNGSVVYKYENEIEFSTTYPDGVINFEFELEDRAGNTAEKKSYYVIKDSGVSGESVKDTGLLRYPRFAVNGIDTVYFVFEPKNYSWNKILIDTFYKDSNDNSYTDVLSVKKVEWGYSIDDNMNVLNPIIATETFDTPFNETIYRDQSYYKFDRDENRETYLRVTVEDSVGNIYLKTVAIPEKAVYIGQREGASGYMFKAYNENCPLEYSYAYLLNYFWDPEYNDYNCSVSSVYSVNYHTYNGVSYIESWHDPKCVVFANRYDFNDWEICGTFSQIYDADGEAIEFVETDMDENLELITSMGAVVQNSGYVDVLAEYPDSFEKNPNLTYLVAIRKDDEEGYTYTEGSYIHLLYGEEYWVTPAVMNNKREFKYGKEVKIVITEDTVPPEMSIIGVNNGTHSYYQTSPNFVKVTVPTDATGIKVEDDGLVHMQYWVIANESVKTGFKERQEADIISYPSKYITYDPLNPPSYLRLPLDDAPENSYTVYVKLVDSSVNHNYKFFNLYTKNVLREYDASFTYENEYQFADYHYNIGLYDTFRYSEKFDLQWWVDKGYIKYWQNAVPYFSDEEDEELIDPNLDWSDRYEMLQYLAGVREARIINEYCADHYTFVSKPAFVYHMDDTDSAIITVEAYENNDWNQISSNYTSSHCLAVAFTEDGEIQWNDKNGQNYDYLTYSSNLFDYSDKFLRVLAVDVEGAGIIHNYWKTIYVYPDYYKNNIVCNNKNIMELSNGLQVFTDKPVLVHTYSCSSNLGDDPDLWLNHGFETGIVQKDTTFTYDKSYLKDVPAGSYYTTVVHFIDGTTLMTTPKIK